VTLQSCFMTVHDLLLSMTALENGLTKFHDFHDRGTLSMTKHRKLQWNWTMHSCKSCVYRQT